MAGAVRRVVIRCPPVVSGELLMNRLLPCPSPSRFAGGLAEVLRLAAVASFVLAAGAAIPADAHAQITWTNYTTGSGLGDTRVFGVYAAGSTIYAATDQGLSISTNGGTNWTNYTTGSGLGSNNMRGVYAASSTIYAATYGGGLSISTNGGTNWTSYTTGSGLASNFTTSVYASGGTIYVGTEGGGLSISTNSGATWTTFNTGSGVANNNVAGVYASGGTIYAATQSGLSFSTNSGATWTTYTTGSGLVNNSVRGVYASGGAIYAATAGGVSISTNNGASWTSYTTDNGLGGNFTPGVFASGSSIYAATAGGLSISTNGGSNWTNYTAGSGLGNDPVWGVYADASTIYAATQGGLSIGVAAIPEPSTYAMALAGLACGGFSIWRRRKRHCIGFVLLVAASMALVGAHKHVQAEVLYSAFGPEYSFENDLGGYGVTGSAVSGAPQNYSRYEKFTTTAAGQLAAAKIAIRTMGPSYEGFLNLDVYEDQSNSPGTLLATWPLMITPGGLATVAATAFLSNGPTLNAATTYWLGFRAGSPLSGLVVSKNAIGLMTDDRIDANGEIFTGGSKNSAVELSTVPEPSTYAMALACIAWAGWGAWRRSGQKRGGRSSIAVMMVPMAFAFGCSGAEGEILSFRVSGSMTTDSSSGGWSAGDPFTATYSFDNLAMGVYDSNIPATFYGASVKSFVFDVAGKNYSMASNANGSISVGNDGFAGSDRYIVTGDTIQHPALADGLTVSFIQFDLIDWTGMALANESLVTSAAVLQGFSSKSGRFRLSNNDQPFFNISSITAVPEPSTWLMGLAGIACGGFSMWRRRKHQRVGRPFLTTASLALIAVCLTFSLAHAAVITFGNTGIDSLFTAGSRTEAGYSYQAFGTEWELTPGTLAFGNPGSALTTVFNGTSPLVGDRVDIVSVTPAAQFVFGSVDWRTGYSSNNQDVVVEGFLGASVVGSISLTGDSLDYQTASGFGSAIDLLRIRVTNANGSGMLFDNLVLNPVPEPSTYCMALAGIACGGYLVRRRKRNRLSRSPIIAASLPLVAAIAVTAGLIGGIAREAVGAPMVLVNNGSQILRFDGTTGASLGNVLVDYGGGSIGGYTFGPDRNIYVTDFNGLQINRFNGSTGAFMNTFATVTLSSPYQPLFGPDGNLYLGQSTGIITKYNGSTGQYLGIFVSPPAGAFDFGGMTFRGNSLYVSYLGQSGSLYRYDAATGGNAQLVYGGFFSNGPRAPVFDNAGTMYVPDWQTNKIFKFGETTLALTGTITTAFGIVPMSLAFDESGALLVLSDNFSQSQINRYNPATGAFIDTLVAPGTGGMGRANSMLFIVPEPSTYAMALAGVASVGYSMWRRFRGQFISCGRSWDVLTGAS
jgi:sugar lactone lactonase YvrE